MDRSVCLVLATLLSAFVASAESATLAVTAPAPRPHVVRLPRPASLRVGVNGVAFDSLLNAPFVGAIVTIQGQADSVVTDSAGRFHVTVPAPGQYVVSVRHLILDSLGFPPLQLRADVTDGRDTIRLATPAFATLWTRHCAGPAPSSDSGFVFGTIRHARTAAPVVDAFVLLHWLELGVSSTHKLKQQLWRADTRSDSTGLYTVCRVPTDVGVRLAAATDSLSSGMIDVMPQERRVRRRDLFLGAQPTRATPARGAIYGTVLDETGAHVANARVTMEEGIDLKSDEDGHFVILSVPPGTRQIEVASIGLVPEQVVVHVSTDDTLRVDVTLRRVTALKAMRIIAALAQTRRVLDFEVRRLSGVGYFKDTTGIGNVGKLQDVISTFPSTTIRTERNGKYYISFPKRSTGACTGMLWVDGRLAEFEELGDIQPRDLAGIEVYPHWMDVPPKFMKPAVECGAVVVWTKWYFAFRN